MLKLLFFLLVVRPLTYVVLGLNVSHFGRLPRSGPAIIVANHNSHLDTLVLMSLLPMRLLRRVRPVAAADYFLCNRLAAWFAMEVIGILPLSRTHTRSNPLAGCFEALKAGDILILFPEGSRGEPEKMQGELKQGVRLIAKKFPDTPVHPVFLHGLGKSLPKGEGLLVPLFCDVIVGEAMTYRNNAEAFMETLRASLESLADEGRFQAWE